MSLNEILETENIDDAKLEILTFNNKEYIFTYYNENGTLVTNLHSTDGTKIKTDFENSGFTVVGNYLVEIGFKDVKSNSISMIYYNSDFENIYEINNLNVDTLEQPFYMTNYQNSTILQLEKEVATDNGYDIVYSYIVIKEYELLQGENQKYGNNNLIFKINGEYSLFNNIEINEVKLDKDNYIVEEGSTIVTLKNEYLKELENGTYKMKINYSDGGYVETTFKVEKTYETQSEKGNSQLDEKIRKHLMILEVVYLLELYH